MKYKLENHPKNLNQVNAFFKERGLPVRVRRGKGYYYWSNHIEWPSIYGLARASDQTFQAWLNDYEYNQKEKPYTTNLA